MKIGNVLSLFDGMSCGQIALNRTGVSYGDYYASEIDDYGIKVTMSNYPNTIQLGSITEVKGSDLPKIDLLIGGSPCQSFSFAGKLKGMSTLDDIKITSLGQYLELKNDGFQFEGQSYLFWEYVRILNEVKPQYFLLENVIMKKEWESVITEALGVEPIEISSSKFVPQARRRLYWTNIPNIEQPKQSEYNINDFIEGEGFASSCGVDRIFKRKEIFNTLTATYWKGIRGSGRPAISTKEGFLDDNRGAHRMLTPEECEKIQSVPLGYTDYVSKTQRYKMLGNGWTIDVISHIFSYIK
jgi:DNA (cytosine-5)-methyltransferase 3A